MKAFFSSFARPGLTGLVLCMFLLPGVGLQGGTESSRMFDAIVQPLGEDSSPAIFRKQSGTPVSLRESGQLRYQSVINWSEGYIDMVGQGAAKQGERNPTLRRIQAERAAVLDAQRQFVELIQGVQVTSNSTLRDLRLDEDFVQSSARGWVRGGRKVAARMLDEEVAEVVLRVPIRVVSEFARDLFETPDRYGWSETDRDRAVAPAPPRLAEPSRREPSPHLSSPVSQGPYTGVVIDCRNLTFSPSIAPKIRRPDGKEVWGTMRVDFNTAHDTGIAGYAHSVEDLRLPEYRKRIGDRYMVIRAIGVMGPAGADAIISHADADWLTSENRRTGFLEKLGVVFLRDYQRLNL